MGLEEKLLGRLAALRPAVGRKVAASRGYAPELPDGWERLAALTGAETAATNLGSTWFCGVGGKNLRLLRLRLRRFD